MIRELRAAINAAHCLQVFCPAPPMILSGRGAARMPVRRLMTIPPRPETTDRQKTVGARRMSKQELIHRIMHINRSARREFLGAFTMAQLRDYLRRLESIPPEMPEVVFCEDLALSA